MLGRERLLSPLGLLRDWLPGATWPFQVKSISPRAEELLGVLRHPGGAEAGGEIS